MTAGECSEAEAAARAALIDVESYEVFLDLATDTGTARSRTEIRFRCREPGAGTFANMSATAVRRAVLNGEPLDLAEVQAGVLADGRIQLTGLAAGNVLSVDAQVGYAGDGRGLNRFTDPSDAAVHVLANCFPTSAPSVYCCFDQPDLRADVTLTVLAPAGWECMANAPVTSRPAPGEAGVWRFAPAARIHPYDVSLCAGPYVTASEEEFPGLGGPIRLTVRCRSRLAAEPGLGRIGGVVRRTLQYYERLLGVACPYRELNVVFAPELAAAAMQVPALMLVSEPFLQRAADQGDDFVPLVLAHEVAHVWFGCLVEGRWWDDLWLAEAMATYLSPLAGDEALGLEEAWADFGIRVKAAAYQADSVPGAPPVSSPVADAADALSRPAAITYSKGAGVIRQLAALIGDDALRAGLRDYLTRYGGSAATLDGLVGCWSAASGRDLTGWAQEWLRTPGTNTLRPELTLAPDGTVRSFAVAQDPAPAPRTHRIAVGMYEREGGRLRRRHLVSAEITGARTAVPELSGAAAPDAVVLNDGDLTLARIRLDETSLRALAACAMDVGDPLTEAVLWNAAWDMTTAAELAAAEFTDLVARRIAAAPRPAGIEELLARAITSADYYALPAQRPGLRQRLAAAALHAIGPPRPGSSQQRALAAGFAASAHSASQLELLRGWLAGASLPGGVTVDLELRGRILATLSARGLASDQDLDALAAGDPVGGERQRATCRALRPDPAAKQAAWAAALAPGQSFHMARAQAEGIWVPGQEDMMAPYRDRYFTEALPAVGRLRHRVAPRLALLLYPATLADPATIAATDAALGAGGLSDPVRLALAEGRMKARQVLTARSRVTPG